MNLDISILWAPGIYCLVSLIVLFVIFLVTYRLARNLIKWLFRGDSLFGQNAIVRLFSFGVAILVIPSLIFDVSFAFGAVFNQIFVEAPSNLFNGLQQSLTYCTSAAQNVYYPSSTELCMVNLGSAFLNVWGSIFSRIYERIWRFPYRDLVLFLTVWAVTAHFLRYATTPPADPPGKTPGTIWLENTKSYLSSPRGAIAMINVAFFLILGVGAYLSTAAIAAIPILQEKTTTFEEVNAESLDQQLEEELNLFRTKFSDDVRATDPLSSLKVLLDRFPEPNPPITTTQFAPINLVITSTSEITSEQSEVQIPKALLTTLKQVEAKERRELEQLYSDWKSMLNDADIVLKGAKENAVRTYTISNLGRKGNKESLQHYLQISNWFNQEMTSFEATLDRCQINLSRAQNDWQAWAEDSSRNISENNPSDILTIDDPDIWDYRVPECYQTTMTVQSSVPERLALGSSFLGPFGTVASWLLETESLALALITGMLGFGLLGAASSTFIRERAKRKPGHPLIGDLTGVIVRGVSAAVVVFLVVEGGLAVFSVGEAEPNPYVLLFTCLVGSVFSERIWRWAQIRLESNFPDEPQEKDDETSSSLSPTIAETSANPPPSTETADTSTATTPKADEAENKPDTEATL